MPELYNLFKKLLHVNSSLEARQIRERERLLACFRENTMLGFPLTFPDDWISDSIVFFFVTLNNVPKVFVLYLFWLGIYSGQEKTMTYEGLLKKVSNVIKCLILC